jgi:hypothetical protein
VKKVVPVAVDVKNTKSNMFFIAYFYKTEYTTYKQRNLLKDRGVSTNFIRRC